MKTYSEIMKKLNEAGATYNQRTAANLITGAMSRGVTRWTKDSLVIAAGLAKLEHAKEYTVKVIELMYILDKAQQKTLINKIVKNLMDADYKEFFVNITEAEKDAKKIVPVTGALEPKPKEGNYYQIRAIVKKYAEAAKKGLKKTPKQFWNDLLRSVTIGGLFLFGNSIAQAELNEKNKKGFGEVIIPYTFGCMIGGYPLAHVQEIEIARSGKVLKFRATGSVFLASQKGALDAVVIQCLILPGYELLVTLTYLWFLFLLGRKEVKEADFSDKNNIIKSVAEIRGKFSELSSYDQSLEKASYEFHQTYPFVSRHVIIPNIYIETLSFEDRVVDGLDVIKCSILCRTYTKPKDFINYPIDAEHSSFGTNSITDTKMYDVLGWMVNTVWRYINSTGIVFDERSWKTGVDAAGQDDIYYNIDALDVATSFGLGVMGLAI